MLGSVRHDVLKSEGSAAQTTHASLRSPGAVHFLAIDSRFLPIHVRHPRVQSRIASPLDLRALRSLAVWFAQRRVSDRQFRFPPRTRRAACCERGVCFT